MPNNGHFRVSFRKGALRRHLALAGLSFREFAAEANVNKDTLLRADNGNEVTTRTFGRILQTLAKHPVPEIPAGLVKTA